MPVMEITLRATYFNRPAINRFNYVASGTPAAVSLSFALAQAFGFIESGGVYPDTNPFGWILRLSHPSVSFVEAQIRDVYSATDFYTIPFTPAVAGLLASGGDAMSPAVAWGMRTNRIRTDVGRGFKRFVGVGEGYVGAGGTIAVGSTEPITVCAAGLSSVIEYDDEGNTLSFVPAVCGKEEYTTPEGNRAYKYYETVTEQLAHTAQGVTWAPYPNVRTQRSRQYKD